MLKKAVVKTAKATKMYGSAISCRLVKLTGKYPQPIHPHHLVQAEELWFLKYLKKDDMVLDIGCHNGQHTLKAAKRVRHVTGFDYDERFLVHAREAAAMKGIENVSLEFGHAEKKFPFEDNSFSAVLFLDVLEHLNERQFSLKEAYRVMKPGGRLFLSVPKRDTPWKNLQKSVGIFYYSDPDHKIEYSDQEIIDELKLAGFTITENMPITYDTWAGGFIDVLGGLHLGLYKKSQVWRRRKSVENPDQSIGFYIVAEPDKKK